MTRRTNDERGSAMVLALGVLAVLAVLAIIIAGIVAAEKQTQTSEYANSRSFYSADAASEAGVHWIRQQTSPPPVIDVANNVLTSTGYTLLSNEHRYRFDVQYVGKRFRPGWSVEYKDYQYVVQAKGASAGQSESAIEVSATRLYREGY